MPKPTKPTLSPYTDQLPYVSNPATWADRTPLFWNWVTGDGYTNMADALTYSDDVAEYLDTALAGSETLIDAVAANKAVLTTLGHRNKIMNGQFNIDQRGGQPYTAAGYTLDRWLLFNGPGSANTIRTYPHSLGDGAGAGLFTKNYLYWDRSTAGTSRSAIIQRIEDVRTLADKSATVTLWVKGNAPTSLDIEIIQDFGSGGSPSADVVTKASANVSVGTAWTAVRLSVNIPSITGKSIGSNGDDHVALRINWNHNAANPTTIIRLSNISLVEGDATAEEDPGAWRNEIIELLMCQRYFQSDQSGIGTQFSGDVTDTKQYYAANRFITPMRITPAISLTHVATVGFASSAGSVQSQSKTGFREVRTANSTATGGFFRGNYTADAEL